MCVFGKERHYYETFIHGHGIMSTKIFQYERHIERLMPLVLCFISVLTFNCVRAFIKREIKSPSSQSSKCKSFESKMEFVKRTYSGKTVNITICEEIG